MVMDGFGGCSHPMESRRAKADTAGKQPEPLRPHSGQSEDQAPEATPKSTLGLLVTYYIGFLSLSPSFLYLGYCYSSYYSLI